MREIEFKKKKANKFYLKLIAVHLLNIILIIIIFVILGKLPGRANEVKALRNQEVMVQENTDVSVIEAELNNLEVKINGIERSFVDESDLLVFIESLDKLKNQGLIASFEPLTTGTVANRGVRGFPLMITFNGSPEHVADGLAEFQKLPFLFKPITAELTYNRDDGNTQFNYGVFLYQNNE